MDKVRTRQTISSFKKVEDVREVQSLKLNQMFGNLLKKAAKITAEKIRRKLKDENSTLAAGGIFNVPSYQKLNQSIIFVDTNDLTKGHKFNFNDLRRYAVDNKLPLKNRKRPLSGLSIATIRSFVTTVEPIYVTHYVRKGDITKFSTETEEN